MKRFYFLLLLFPNFLLAQQVYNCTLTGQVIDKDSRAPLTGVNVVVNGNGQLEAATTDETGQFKIEELLPGRVNVKCTMIGYEETILQEVFLSTGKQTNLQITIQEKVTQINEVVIISGNDRSRAKNEFAGVSSFSFSVEEAKRYAATLNDPARMAQTFAGVISSNDESNQIVVRGNSPKGMLWKLEGIEIANPNHFAASEGSTGGGVSMLSANMLGNTDFYTGAFQAEFGNALSGVFDLHFRRGNTEKHEFAAQIGILGIEAAAEGPFSKKYKGSFLLNYRYSTLDILKQIGLTFGLSQTPKYQDLAMNVYLPMKKRNYFTLFALGGMSSLGNRPIKDSLQWDEPNKKQVEDLRQMMGVFGITNTIYLDENKTSLYSVASVSASQNNYLFDTLNNLYEPQNLENATFQYITFRAASTLIRKVDLKNVVKTGLIFSYYNFDLFNRSPQAGFSTPQTNIQTKGNTYLLQGFYQWKHRFNNRFNIISGVHFTYSFINKKFYAEPRASIEYRVKEAHTLTAGVGLHNRLDAFSTYRSQIPSVYNYPTNYNSELEMSRAFHSVIGYNFSFLKDFRVKSEIYFQYLFNIPAGFGTNDFYSAINQNDGFVAIPLKSVGQGMNYGMEVTVEKFFTHNYYFLFTTSLFNSKYKTESGKWYNTTYNTQYLLNWIGGKEFVLGKKRLSRIAINAKVLWRGGMRQTPVDLEASQIARETVYDWTQPFSQKLQDYVRVDLGLSYRKTQKRWDWQIGVEMQNVINRENVAAQVYDKATQKLIYKRNLGIVPVFYFKVQF